MLALLIDRMRHESLPKSFMFMPMAISFVGASIIWKFVYEYRDPSQPQIGLLSQVCIWLGWKNPPNWLLEPPLNTFLLMVIMVWIQVGLRDGGAVRCDQGDPRRHHRGGRARRGDRRAAVPDRDRSR